MYLNIFNKCFLLRKKGSDTHISLTRKYVRKGVNKRGEKRYFMSVRRAFRNDTFVMIFILSKKTKKMIEDLRFKIVSLIL